MTSALGERSREGARSSILHFADSDRRGGAAKAGHRLHTALREAGHRSRMVVGGKYSEDDDVHLVAPYLNPWASRLRRLRRHLPLVSGRLPPAETVFHYDVGLDIRTEELYRFADEDVDVVYLQHVRYILPTREIRALHSVYRRPLVWMLHSMAPFTGGCNYTLGCDRFHARCGLCPQLGSGREHDRSREIWLRKAKYLRDLPLTFVAPSRQVGAALAESSLFADHRVEVIPNPIDARVFRPGDRTAARELLGLPPEARVVVATAVGWENVYKGADLLREALSIASSSVDDGTRSALYVAVAGLNGRQVVDGLPVAGRALGQLTDDVAMALLYQAADLVVCSSRAETGAQTIAESLLCGTPVVSFEVGAAPDLLTAATGYVARPGDARDLAAGIVSSLDRADEAGVAARCREAALDCSYERVAEAHERLWRSLLVEAALL